MGTTSIFRGGHSFDLPNLHYARIANHCRVRTPSLRNCFRERIVGSDKGGISLSARQLGSDNMLSLPGQSIARQLYPRISLPG